MSSDQKETENCHKFKEIRSFFEKEILEHSNLKSRSDQQLPSAEEITSVICESNFDQSSDCHEQNNDKSDKNTKNDKILQKHENVNPTSRLSNRRKQFNMPLMYRMNQSQSDDVHGTVTGPADEDFRPEQASEKLKQALNGLGTSDKVIIDIAVNYNNFQRQRILKTYEDRYCSKLMNDFKSNLGGFFFDAISALFAPAHFYSANILSQIIQQMVAIRNAYESSFNSTLERDVKMKIEGAFGNMLHMLLFCPRDDEFHGNIDVKLVEEDVNLVKNVKQSKNLLFPVFYE
ncbi:unnamed protein product [Thelazia callipaeda]|uniref:Annexin n=1 Tax=Thelazia callipaeda TaxID=103827 RepID=A0A0N5CMZ1_THECL|nr:unnamed protein product [Thelazia callipaeda]